uniref:Uncharacterized protein n=1 Tax=Arundo donax TaxID=35708 RepID=A0A0A9G9G2_ARUDO
MRVYLVLVVWKLCSRALFFSVTKITLLSIYHEGYPGFKRKS